MKIVSKIIYLFVILCFAGEVIAVTYPFAGGTYTLAGSGISSSATSLTLQSLTIPQTDYKILDSDLSTVFYLTIEPGSKTKQEILACTTLTQNAGGTATISGCERGMSPITPFTASSTLQFVHAGGSQVTLSNPPQLYNRYAAKDNTELISGQWTASSTNPLAYDNFWGESASSTSKKLTYNSWVFNNFMDKYTAQTIAGVKSFSDNLAIASGKVIDWVAGNGVISGLATPTSSDTDHAANVAYVNAVAIQGVASSSATVAGISKLSKSPVDANIPIAVGDNDPRIQNYTLIYSTSTDSYKQLTTPTAGYGTSTLYLDNFATTTEIEIVASTTVDSFFAITFNGEYSGTNYSSYYIKNGDAGNTSGAISHLRLPINEGSSNGQFYLRMKIFNSTTTPKYGTFQASVNTKAGVNNAEWHGAFTWASTTASINKISFGPAGGISSTTTIRAILTK